MSAGQSFTKRVTLPLFVMLLTVGLLTFTGLSMARLRPSNAGTPATDSAPQASTKPTVRPAVDVFNGTVTSGLARQVSGVLATRGWQIEKVGNWSGKQLSQSTVYYPVGGIDAAQVLARETSAVIAPTLPNLNQSTLTLVILK